MSDETAPVDQPTKDELKAAMKAFKKRLKLTKLDEESKMSRRPTTSGQASGITGITPPKEHRQAVWDELVKQGRLKRSKLGLYELPPE